MRPISKDKKLFLLGSVIIAGLLLCPLIFYFEKQKAFVDTVDIDILDKPWRMRLDFNELKKNNIVQTQEDFRTVVAFIKLFQKMNSKREPWVYWLGILSFQNPLSNWTMQEIITKLKPDFIIETGTFMGGDCFILCNYT